VPKSAEKRVKMGQKVEFWWGFARVLLTISTTGLLSKNDFDVQDYRIFKYTFPIRECTRKWALFEEGGGVYLFFRVESGEYRAKIDWFRCPIGVGCCCSMACLLLSNPIVRRREVILCNAGADAGPGWKGQ
jgi:hypothetical protein